MRSDSDRRRKIVVSGRRGMLLLVVLLLVLPWCWRLPPQTPLLIVGLLLGFLAMRTLGCSSRRSVSPRLIFVVASAAAELATSYLRAVRPPPLHH